MGEEQEVGAEHAGDGAGRPDGRDRRIDVRVVVREPGNEPGQQIEDEKAAASHALLDVVAEDPQGPHVADDVHEAAVQEHAGDERPVAVDGKADCHRPVGVAIAGGHDPEQVDEGFELLRAERQLEQKDQDVDEDQRPRDEGHLPTGDGVAQRNHCGVPARSEYRVTQTNAGALSSAMLDEWR